MLSEKRLSKRMIKIRKPKCKQNVKYAKMS